MTLPTTQKIRDVSDIVTKGTTPTTVGRNYTSSGINFLKVETFTSDGIFIPGKQGHIDEPTHQLLKRSQLAEGDILFSIAGALGRSTIVDKSWLPANTNQAFAIIRPSSRNQAINPRYLLWQLRSPAIAKRIAEINVQAAQANLSLEQVREFDLLSLPRAEQNVIAAALDDVDQLVAALERLVSKKQAIKQGLMQELLTGRTRLSGFTKPWKNISIARHSHLKARIGWQGLTTGEYLQSGSYKLIGGTDFRNARIDWESASFVSKWRFDQDRNIQLRVNDVLITKDGTIGKVAIVDSLPFPATLNSGVFVVRPIQGAYESRFLYWLLRSSVFENFIASLSAGSTINHLYQKDLITLTLAFPEDASEQREISSVLDDAESEIRVLEARLETARNIKQGMMQELLTGRTRLPVEEVSS